MNRLENSEFLYDSNNFGSALSNDSTIGHSYKLLRQTYDVTPSQLTSTGNNTFKTALRLTNSASGQQYIGLVAPIKAQTLAPMLGQVIKASAYVRTNISQDVNIAIVWQTTTADSPTTSLVNLWTSTSYISGSFFISGTSPLDDSSVTSVSTTSVTANTWTQVSTSITVPVTATNLMMFIWPKNQVAASATFDVTGTAIYESASHYRDWETMNIS